VLGLHLTHKDELLINIQLLGSVTIGREWERGMFIYVEGRSFCLFFRSLIFLCLVQSILS
jgi:hypothetical protein